MELPILNVHGEINFLMQCGLVRDRVSIDISDLNLKTLKDTACNFIDRKFQEHGKNRLSERLILFKHDYNFPNMLMPINVASDITDGSLVEIVLSSNEPSEEIQIRPHYLQVHSFKTPTFCDFCGELLFGLTRQGLKCEDCALICHKRCAYKIPNNCTYYKRRRSSTHLMANSSSTENISRTASAIFTENLIALLPTSPSHQRRGSSSSEKGFFSSFTNHSGSNVSSSTATTPTSSGPCNSLITPQISQQLNVITGRPAWVERELACRIRVPHTFLVHSYKRPTLCQQCKKLLKGFFRQGKQCKDCKFNVHKKCVEKVPMNCTGEAPKEWIENEFLPNLGNGEKNESGEVGEVGDGLLSVNRDEDSEGESENSTEINELNTEQVKTIDDLSFKINLSKNLKACTDDEESKETLDAFDVSNTNYSSDASANNIPLMRLVQSFKHTKRKDAKILKEGWMIHFSNRDSMGRSQRKRHFWRLDSKSITLFQHDISSNFYKEILISEILAINPSVNMEDYGFELLTKNLSYFCGEKDNYETKEWEIAIRKIYMPSLTEKDNQHDQLTNKVKRDQTNQSINRSNSKNIDKNIFIINIMTSSVCSNENENKNVQYNHQSDFDISLQYQIFPDEVLGSGQFGIVYGGVHRTSGRTVAIKVIDKLRFPKQEAQLKNEVSILQNISHPGVVNLEKMFETKERIFVVMENLRGDMLEMILSSEKQRLTERCTKFLIYQILVALKYLHSRNIVHCDLKPENVLLSSDSDFPQVKLCDFGFARIIGEKSFRRSLVGTPAYLAPEVLRNKYYNRLLDMWSVGVIIYVSLSGTFPFNEEEDINDQIQNAAFMYPSNPWREISDQAIDLIKNLLQVKAKKRYTVDKSLWHPWLENYETWCDIRELEVQTKQRWCTHESDDARWEAYRIENKLLIPNHQSINSNLSVEQQKNNYLTNQELRVEPDNCLSTIKDQNSNPSSNSSLYSQSNNNENEIIEQKNSNQIPKNIRL